MPAAKKGPEVVGKVDEENGTVSIGVVFDGSFLPVASKNLDYATAVGLDAEGNADGSDDDEGGEK